MKKCEKVKLYSRLINTLLFVGLALPAPWCSIGEITWWTWMGREVFWCRCQWALFAGREQISLLRPSIHFFEFIFVWISIRRQTDFPNHLPSSSKSLLFSFILTKGSWIVHLSWALAYRFLWWKVFIRLGRFGEREKGWGKAKLQLRPDETRLWEKKSTREYTCSLPFLCFLVSLFTASTHHPPSLLLRTCNELFVFVKTKKVRSSFFCF